MLILLPDEHMHSNFVYIIFCNEKQRIPKEKRVRIQSRNSQKPFSNILLYLIESESEE